MFGEPKSQKLSTNFFIFSKEIYGDLTCKKTNFKRDFFLNGKII